MTRPILTYATETRAETKRTKQKMRVIEMKVMRSILNVTLRGRQTKHFHKRKMQGTGRD